MLRLDSEVKYQVLKQENPELNLLLSNTHYWARLWRRTSRAQLPTFHPPVKDLGLDASTEILILFEQHVHQSQRKKQKQSQSRHKHQTYVYVKDRWKAWPTSLRRVCGGILRDDFNEGEAWSWGSATAEDWSKGVVRDLFVHEEVAEIHEKNYPRIHLNIDGMYSGLQDMALTIYDEGTEAQNENEADASSEKGNKHGRDNDPKAASVAGKPLARSQAGTSASISMQNKVKRLKAGNSSLLGGTKNASKQSASSSKASQALPIGNSMPETKIADPESAPASKKITNMKPTATLPKLPDFVQAKTQKAPAGKATATTKAGTELEPSSSTPSTATAKPPSIERIPSSDVATRDGNPTNIAKIVAAEAKNTTIERNPNKPERNIKEEPSTDPPSKKRKSNDEERVENLKRQYTESAARQKELMEKLATRKAEIKMEKRELAKWGAIAREGRNKEEELLAELKGLN